MMANKSSPSLGSVIVIVLVARPVPNVRLKAALRGGVGGAVAAQVPLPHHLGPQFKSLFVLVNQEWDRKVPFSL